MINIIYIFLNFFFNIILFFYLYTYATTKWKPIIFLSTILLFNIGFNSVMIIRVFL